MPPGTTTLPQVMTPGTKRNDRNSKNPVKNIAPSLEDMNLSRHPGAGEIVIGGIINACPYDFESLCESKLPDQSRIS